MILSYVAAVTSCGLPLKTLLRTPMFCDGYTLVLLAAVPGGSAAAASGRFSFGTTSSITGLRCEFGLVLPALQ